MRGLDCNDAARRRRRSTKSDSPTTDKLPVIPVTWAFFRMSLTLYGSPWRMLWGRRQLVEGTTDTEATSAVSCMLNLRFNKSTTGMHPFMNKCVADAACTGLSNKMTLTLPGTLVRTSAVLVFIFKNSKRSKYWSSCPDPDTKLITESIHRGRRV